MSGVEIGLAIVATVDLCFKHGNNLMRICNSVKNAEAEIAERVIAIESQWKRTEIQLEFLRKVWQSLDVEHQSIQIQVLQVLVGKLTVATTKIDSLLTVKPETTLSSGNSHPRLPGITKWKFAFLRERLDEVIQDLTKWQTMFDPTWFLIILASNSQIDVALTQQNQMNASASVLSATQQLRSTIRSKSGINLGPDTSVFLPEDELNSALITDIPFSSAKIAQRAGSHKLLVLDSFNCVANVSSYIVSSDVRELARKLSQTDPIGFGLLRCRGVVRNWVRATAQSQALSFTFVFRTVEGFLPPQSLRARLLAPSNRHSLSDRLQVARDLAKSISFVHTFGFVHKNIRPENVLLSTENPQSLGHSFLVGFEEFRNAEGQTLRLGDATWERNLYRHPGRQGLKPDDYFIMQHDIYSLGVSLLEIGIWESFVLYDDNGVAHPSPHLASFLTNASEETSVNIKDALVSLAQTICPSRMGSKYARVVETCLTCLDYDNVDFGDEREFQDSDGILVGVRYIEKVLLQLDNISM